MMHRLSLKSFCLLLLCTAILNLPDKASCKDGDKSSGVRVAVLLDLTGKQATLGRPAMNGFVLALEEARGDRAGNVFVSLRDTQTDPDVTLAIARSVVSEVSIAVGFTDNDSVLVSGPVFQKYKIPFLSIGATDPSLPVVVGDQIFLTPFGDNTQAAAAAEFAETEFGRTAAILWDSTSQYSRTLPLYFRARFEQLGGKVFWDHSYAGGCDVSVLGEQIARLTPQPAFIYLAGLPDCIGAVVESLRVAGVNQPIIGGDGLDTPNLLNGNAGPTENIWFTTHAWLSPETGTLEARQFLAAYEMAYGAAPSDAFAALGYDAGKLILDALARVKKPTPKNLAKALAATRGFKGVTGTISYSTTNHVPQKTVWIVHVSGGQSDLAKSFIPEKIPPAVIPSP